MKRKCVFATCAEPEGNLWSAVFWDPPVQERYVWQSERPAKPRALRIYECHIGISGQQTHITSFNEFTRQVILLTIHNYLLSGN